MQGWHARHSVASHQIIHDQGKETVPRKKEILTALLFFCLIALGVMAIAGFYRIKENVLAILEHPAPVLRQVAEPVDRADASIAALAADLISTLRYFSVVDFFMARSVPRGLAAPQVGVSKRVLVCGINGRIKVMINPKILERKGTFIDLDDCMSVQEESKTYIRRSAYVRVKYKTLDNREEILVVKNDNAALVEHEVDHLNGVLNLDY